MVAIEIRELTIDDGDAYAALRAHALEAFAEAFGSDAAAERGRDAASDRARLTCRFVRFGTLPRAVRLGERWIAKDFIYRPLRAGRSDHGSGISWMRLVPRPGGLGRR